ncbi:hypothetical protein [Streptomyces sp. NBC_00986]|uniref:hypothetical protein n=1 Tax=Streptomyces sp. NBC_00986 TaxID=2903702 RepID=UPI0038709BBC|nr:hypothetical protein OG504_24665 [Streptomyces sp. NBC_00986]
MSALFVHKAAAGAASSTIASGHVAFAAADRAGVAVVVGDVRPRTARRDGRKD